MNFKEGDLITFGLPENVYKILTLVPFDVVCVNNGMVFKDNKNLLQHRLATGEEIANAMIRRIKK